MKIKKLITISLLLLSTTLFASSYEIIGYSNKGHYERVFGSALINDSCDMYIVLGEDSYHLKCAPKLSRNRLDGKTESRGTCNGVECYIAVNKGTLEIIEVRFKDGELIRFYVK